MKNDIDATRSALVGNEKCIYSISVGKVQENRPFKIPNYRRKNTGTGLREIF